MRIDDILYFAPEIRFRDVDLDGASLPEQFRRRVIGFYLEPVEQCIQTGYAFAAGVLLVSCIDALARVRFGAGVIRRFGRFVDEQLRSFSGDDLAERFFDEFRNGLVHEARLKNGAQFSLQTGATLEQRDGILLVNPKFLAEEVRWALDAYVALIRRDDVARQSLADVLRHDFAKDFQIAAG